ncbi:TetR/AcrR family transcriptional regulator [Actinomadura livida]|uniref:AcrR family transcriptional regulator n=1 Tax=Actinomadura livida TaxID=79909 RepID=A0A7W7N237_9ACTN|nr:MULTISPECIES: TetR/AcrR family transcriptional regulator [Actinomadura]MBB4778595.1 AcrR family transcriptional regulator [Actinomadura catellatispora]GGU30128.1 TetR family transcriptional regulator [Actinomadura livida]
MGRSPGLSPRRIPRQDRSRQTVERILEAATRVLSDRGYDGASTNRIAKAAGISNGSLYQYFPNKDAIVIAVLDRFADRLADRLGAEIEATMRLPWQEAGRALLDVQIRLFEENADLLRIIVEQIPRLGPFDKLAALQRRLTDLVRVYLLVNRAEFRDDLDVEATVWILAETVGLLSIKYVLDRPPIPHDRMVDELADLVIGYIRG